VVHRHFEPVEAAGGSRSSERYSAARISRARVPQVVDFSAAPFSRRPERHG
jgi:hypothetical protein